VPTRDFSRSDGDIRPLCRNFCVAEGDFETGPSGGLGVARTLQPHSPLFAGVEAMFAGHGWMFAGGRMVTTVFAGVVTCVDGDRDQPWSPKTMVTGG
jgi:hypothetical protein